MEFNFSKIEKIFFKESKYSEDYHRMLYNTVDSFPKLGLLWRSLFGVAAENPNGVVSLPTSKTAQYFFAFRTSYSENWDNEKGRIQE